MSPALAGVFFTTRATWESPAETLYPLPTSLHLPYPTQLLAINFLLFVSTNLIFFQRFHMRVMLCSYLSVFVYLTFFGNF